MKKLLILLIVLFAFTLSSEAQRRTINQPGLYSGTSTPNSSTGFVDAHYLRVTDGKIYKRRRGGWTMVYDIISETGSNVLVLSPRDSLSQPYNYLIWYQNGVVKDSFSSVAGDSVYAAENGIKIQANTLKMGGQLTESTHIPLNGQKLYTSGTGELNLLNRLTGTPYLTQISSTHNGAGLGLKGTSMVFQDTTDTKVGNISIGDWSSVGLAPLTMYFSIVDESNTGISIIGQIDTAFANGDNVFFLVAEDSTQGKVHIFLKAQNQGTGDKLAEIATYTTDVEFDAKFLLFNENVILHSENGKIEMRVDSLIDDGSIYVPDWDLNIIDVHSISNIDTFHHSINIRFDTLAHRTMVQEGWPATAEAKGAFMSTAVDKDYYYSNGTWIFEQTNTNLREFAGARARIDSVDITSGIAGRNNNGTKAWFFQPEMRVRTLDNSINMSMTINSGKEANGGSKGFKFSDGPDGFYFDVDNFTGGTIHKYTFQNDTGTIAFLTDIKNWASHDLNLKGDRVHSLNGYYFTVTGNMGPGFPDNQVLKNHGMVDDFQGTTSYGAGTEMWFSGSGGNRSENFTGRMDTTAGTGLLGIRGLSADKSPYGIFGNYRSAGNAVHEYLVNGLGTARYVLQGVGDYDIRLTNSGKATWRSQNSNDTLTFEIDPTGLDESLAFYMGGDISAWGKGVKLKMDNMDEVATPTLHDVQFQDYPGNIQTLNIVQLNDITGNDVIDDAMMRQGNLIVIAVGANTDTLFMDAGIYDGYHLIVKNRTGNSPVIHTSSGVFVDGAAENENLPVEAKQYVWAATRNEWLEIY